jgi:hypothetical protein
MFSQEARSYRDGCVGLCELPTLILQPSTGGSKTARGVPMGFALISTLSHSRWLSPCSSQSSQCVRTSM